MTRRIRFGALALAALAAAALGSCAPQTSPTVATVGSRKITVADFENAARSSPYLALDSSPTAKRRLLNELIDRALVLDEIHRRGLDKDTLLARVRTAAEQEVLPEKLYARVVHDRVRVSDAEVKALWEQMDTEMHLAQIFSFNENEARAALARLHAGEPFAQVAHRSSRDQTTAANGGDMGYVAPGQLPADIEEALRKVPVGRWTEPLKTPVGYYIVQVLDRRKRAREPYGQVAPGLQSMLRQRKERTLVLAYVEGLRQRYHLERNPAGLSLLAVKWQNRTTEQLLAAQGDPHKLGFTEPELATPLVRFDGGAYTIRDFFADLASGPTLERPPQQDDPTLRVFLEDRATFRLLLAEARRRGLDRDPDVQRQLRDREDSYLINKFYQQVVVPAAQPTLEEVERIRSQAGTKSGPQAQQDASMAEAKLFEAKRRQTLASLLARLRKDHPPQVNEKALAGVPWPVPPKENA